MRGAPPVLMACGRDARAAVGAGLLSATAAATVVGWLGWHVGWTPAAVVTAIVVAALPAGMVAGRLVDRVGERRLAWDGRTWALDGTPGEVAVMVDIGNWMLLRFRHAGAVAWLPLVLHRCGAPAHLARAALHAHAGRAPAGAGAGLDVNG